MLSRKYFASLISTSAGFRQSTDNNGRTFRVLLSKKNGFSPVSRLWHSVFITEKTPEIYGKARENDVGGKCGEHGNNHNFLSGFNASIIFKASAIF